MNLSSQSPPKAVGGGTGVLKASVLSALAALAALALAPAAQAQAPTHVTENTSVMHTDEHWTELNAISITTAFGTTDPIGSGVTIDGMVAWDIGNNYADKPNVPVTITVNEDLTISHYSVSIAAVASTAPKATVTGDTLILGTGAKVKGSAFGGAVLAADGTVKGNTLNVALAATVGGFTGGGFALSGTASENKVIFGHATGTDFTGTLGVFGAMLQNGGKADLNSVTVDASTGNVTTTDIIGARSGGVGTAGNVLSGNFVSVKGITGNAVTVSGSVYGASVIGQSAALGSGTKTWHELTENNVDLERGTVTGNVAGAMGGTGSPVAIGPVANAVFSKNSVTLAGNAGIGGGVYGAMTSGATANFFKENRVTITGTVSDVAANYVDHIYGAFGHSGEAAGNEVTITPGAAFRIGDGAGGNVAGASMSHGGKDTVLDQNKVSIDSGTYALDVKGSVMGASSAAGTATGNSVAITGAAKIAGDVVGGSLTSGTATGNKAELGSTLYSFSGSIDGAVFGARISSGIGTDSVTGNSVTLTGADLARANSSSPHADVYGGSMTTAGTGSVERNLVIAKDGSVAGNMVGGNLTTSGAGDVYENSVSLESGSTAANVYGGRLTSTRTGGVFRNTATVKEGSSAIDVVGGYLAGAGTGDSF
ncbi:MAG: hypothetical protein LBR80_08050, partial [Deltaproteobacteria bacterium]|nr:hypothetical protein [Deltaproteobacteria bacterium]